jgi:iron complex transport system permease protein
MFLCEKHKKNTYMIVTLIIFMIMIALFSLTLGSYEMTVLDIIRGLLRTGENNTNELVIFTIRLPRITAAIVAGFALSIAGCIMQNNLNNPLASPSTLGISPAATFGANFAIIFLGAGSLSGVYDSSLFIQNPYVVTMFAFLFAMGAVLLILLLSNLTRFHSSTIILAGVALSSLFQAGTIILQYFASEDDMTRAVFWTFGDLTRVRWNELLLLLVITVMSFVYFMYKRTDYDALIAGDDIAKSLGVHTKKTRYIGLILSSLITATCISFLGLIAFVGLLGPHISKKIVGSSHQHLILMSGVMGAIILLIADMISKSLFAPITLPIGSITSFVGGILFLYILLRKEFKI